MILIITLYFILLGMLCIAWKYDGIHDSRHNVFLFGLCTTLLLFITVITRDGSILPDYQEYLILFNDPNIRAVEFSFILITNTIKQFSNNPIWLFAIYALLSILIRYYAIWKYSPNILYSLCVWISTYLLLHEMIQIRGAVASAILLILIPNIYKRKFLKSLSLILVAFIFHRSAIAYLVLLLLHPRVVKWKFWIYSYLIVLAINILNIDIIKITGLTYILNDIQLLEGDIYDLSKSRITLNMFAPYILLQTITCFVCIYKYKMIERFYPLAGICIRVCLLGIILYSLPLGVVSLRLAELFSTVFIFVYPLLLYCFKNNIRNEYGKVIVSIICVSILTNFVFIKHFIHI